MELILEGLTKQYSKTVAVDHVDLKLNKGVIGLLGANGSGKTTMMKMICGILPPTTGHVYYDGQEILKNYDSYVTNLGYMPQHLGFYPSFTIQEFLEYMSVVKGLKKEFYKKKIDELLIKLNLEDKRKAKIKSLSGGMLRRVGIAQALLNEPKILILDEPTAGLDPKERIGIRNYIAELSRDKIILFATHVVSDIECIADKVLLLKDGEIIATGTPSQLIENMQGKVGEVVCTLSDVADLQGKYHIGNIRQRKNGMVLRLVGDELPEEAVRVDNDIDLEDVYLYYFE